MLFKLFYVLDDFKFKNIKSTTISTTKFPSYLMKLNFISIKSKFNNVFKFKGYYNHSKIRVNQYVLRLGLKSINIKHSFIVSMFKKYNINFSPTNVVKYINMN